MSNTARWGWRVALMIIFAVTALRIHSIHSTAMRADEGIAFDTTSRDLAYAIDYQANQDIQAPLWFGMFWLWQQVAGSSEFAARAYAVFLSMLTLALVYRIGRRWFRAVRYGWFALTLLGVNAYFHIYSLEIRPYALVMLTAALSMVLFWNWLERPSRRTAILYGLSIALMLYVHYFTAFLVAVQVVFFVADQGLRPRSSSKNKMFAQGFLAATIAFVLWLPWFPIFINQIAKLQHIETDFGNVRGLGIATTTEPTTLSAVFSLMDVVTNGLAPLYGLIVLVGACYLWRRRAFWLVLVWGVGVPAVALLVNLIAAVYTPRYVAYLSLGIGLAMGASLAVLHPRLRWLALIGMATISLWLLPTQLPHDRIPFRDLFRQVSAIAGPEDVLWFDDGDLGDPFVRGQIRRYLAPDLWARRVDSLEAAQSQRRVWYITGLEWFSDETQGRFSQIEATHPLQTVLGRCDHDWCYLLQLLEAPPLAEPVLFGDALEFRGLDVDQVTPESLTVRLWWIADSPIGLDYSIGLHVLDADGTLVAQHDGPITDFYAGQPVQTSQMDSGKVYIDTRHIELPPGLPKGAYQLALVVYQSWDGRRLPLPDGTDELRLDDVSLSGS
ncbi:MAG: glycosyltransferase family 39 protein [Anaerolineae bacterium]|nr:glycosyltransferase family 39 protein [Anaerolineae bacterium]